MHNTAPRPSFAAVIVFALGLLSAYAQARAAEPAPTAPNEAPPLDAQIALLQQHVALQQEKVRTLTADMVAIDQGVEREVSRLVEQIAALSDSPDSDTKVVNQKRETIEALKKTIDFYRKQREERKAQLLHPTYANVSDADLENDIQKLDERVEQRVDQIMQVTASLAQDPNLAGENRYRTDEYGRRTGVNEHARQADRSSQRGDNARGKVREGLEIDKDKLEAENARLKQQITLTHDPDTVAFLKDSIAWNEEQIARRETLAMSVLTSSAGGQQPVSRRTANEIDQAFDETRLDIKADYQKLLALKTRRDQERARLKQLTDKLERSTAAQQPAPPSPTPP